MEENRGIYSFGTDPDRQRILGTSRHTWKDDSEVVLKEIGWKGVSMTNLAQDWDNC
jgi:hypothetical protein